HGLGLLQGAFGVGFIFGPAFGGVLSNYGSTVPFIGAAIITAITFLLTFFTLRESLTAEERKSSVPTQSARFSLAPLIRNPDLQLIIGVTFFSTLAFSALPATFALYAERVLFVDSVPANRVQLAIGLMLTLHGMLIVITQVAILQRLIQRLGERRVLVIGDLALVVAMVGVGLAGVPIVAVIAFMPFAFGQGVTQPSLQSLMTRFGGRGTGGRLLGIYQSTRSLALIFGPIWAGYVFEGISPRAVFMLGAVFMLVATFLAVKLLRIPAQHNPLALD
ncbi:MAG: MFS transporter, partial [Anaerolineales bacterium]